jgi:hypothetical protein
MELEEWLDALAAELELGDIDMNTDAMHTVLDLARDAAHQIDRPAAPLTSYLVGVAVGRGASLGSVAATATQLALNADR